MALESGNAVIVLIFRHFSVWIRASCSHLHFLAYVLSV